MPPRPGLARTCRILPQRLTRSGSYLQVRRRGVCYSSAETPIEAAKQVAERLRLSIMENPITTDSGPLRITVSVGVAEANSLDTLQKLIERADEALYDAKHAGRNCVRARE